MFNMDSAYITEVTVDARVFNQQFINRFYYRFSDPGSGPTGGTSNTFLTNFITAYRAGPLSRLYTVYTVYRYWLRTITSAALIAGSAPPRYKPVYSVSLFDYRAGSAALDIGALTAVEGDAYLPAANALRAFKKPDNPFRGFFNRNYNRFGVFTVADLDPDAADHDEWLPATVTAWTTMWNTFLNQNILDQALGNGWDHGLFSAQYYGEVLLPTLQPVWGAFLLSNEGQISPYVGTQVTRRYTPPGLIRGK